MCRGRFSVISDILLLVVVLGFVLSAGACKKSPTRTRQPQTTAAPKAETAETKPAVVQDTNKVEAAKPAPGVEVIPIVLPRPMFVGTPERFIGVTNLEKPLGRPREPFYAPKGTTNIALNKPVTSSDEQPIIGELAMITDGDKEAADGSYVELGPGRQHITIDLGASYNIFAIVVWHYHKQPRVYKDVVVQTADDSDFITNVRTVFNNDDDNTLGLGAGTNMNYVETAEGKLIDAKGVIARYVRCFSNGNSSNDLNNYIEVEVYGLPVVSLPAPSAVEGSNPPVK
jgi:hypothetical protein